MDQIQKRYGWTDEVTHSLTFARFIEICGTVAYAKQQEAKEQMALAAFIGWQQAKLFGYKYSFARYLEDLGLIEKHKPTAIELQQRKAQALARAAKIVEMDKRRRG